MKLITYAFSFFNHPKPAFVNPCGKLGKFCYSKCMKKTGSSAMLTFSKYVAGTVVLGYKKVENFCLNYAFL